jgi:hypothetical protein
MPDGVMDHDGEPDVKGIFNHNGPARPMRSQFDSQEEYDQALVDYSIKMAAKQVVAEMRADRQFKAIITICY